MMSLLNSNFEHEQAMCSHSQNVNDDEYDMYHKNRKFDDENERKGNY